MSMESAKNVPVSGVSVIMPECPKCGKKKARGVYMVREQDGRHIFKCDYCGRKRSMGWGEAQHMIMVDEKNSYERMGENRERWRREITEKFNEDYAEAVDNVETPPDAIENFNHMLHGPQLESETSLSENDSADEE